MTTWGGDQVCRGRQGDHEFCFECGRDTYSTVEPFKKKKKCQASEYVRLNFRGVVQTGDSSFSFVFRC